MRYLLILILMILCFDTTLSQGRNVKIKIGVAGMTHGHVSWILQQMEGKNYEVVGIAEENDALVKRLFDRHGIDPEMRYSSLEKMLDECQPDAVVAFNSIFEHLEVVEKCAPRKIHVMVEKPLAVNPAHAQRMTELALQNEIHLLTNYETTWYGSTTRVMEAVLENNVIGDLRKVVVRDGHMGPREIGVSSEFLEWLTDPRLNGGGALIDFGCYGANLITRLMSNQRPLTVTAVTQQIKPDIYPAVDDEATIILTYPSCQGIIQASWNWPLHRKDMDIYGVNGYIYQFNSREMEIHKNGKSNKLEIEENVFPYDDPFSYFASVVSGAIDIHAEDLSSLENNLIVVEILDAARRSAGSGKTVELK